MRTCRFQHFFSHTIILIFGLAAASSSVLCSDSVVQLGKGSYTTEAPNGMKLPPAGVFKTGSHAGPVQTTDWWSSIAWENYSHCHFPHPLSVKAEKRGLSFGYPGPFLNATEKHVIAGFREQVLLGHSNASEFPDARVAGASDWFVDVMFAKGKNRMRVSYGHGSPFVYARFEGGGPVVQVKQPFSIWYGKNGDAVLGITSQGCHYGLFGPTGSSWEKKGAAQLVNRSAGKTYCSIALLPDKALSTLKLFASYAHNHVVDTTCSWTYEQKKQQIKTVFTFTSRSFEGKKRGTIFALYPHQWSAAKAMFLQGNYVSVRGPMKIAAGDSFTTIHPYPGVLPEIPLSKECDRELLATYLRQAKKRPVSNPQDTYWHGKSLNTLVNLKSTATQAGGKTEAAAFTKELRERLERWFTVPGGENRNAQYFYYNKTWSTLIGHKPSYGTSDQLNDHHFHYGYFIRAAADLARYAPSWASHSAWGGMVELLINDIACPDRDNSMFPFLRCFDPYAGHAWASGSALFADGNNQESCSESMNAWTGIILWGEATQNRKLRDLGIYLYATELAAINAYWFDVEDRLFPSSYKQSCAALIWGGKTDFATWFSGEPEHIHGIIMLPIQSGSLYLGVYPEYVRRNLESCARLRGSFEWKHWHETLFAYEALADPDKAFERFTRLSGKIGAHERPFVYHWICALKAMGQVERSIKADSPTAIAFTKNSRRTYVACNMSKKRRQVRFSDGMQFAVEPGSCVVKTK